MSIPKFTIENRRQEAVLLAALLGVGLVAAYGWGVRPHVGALQAAQRYERSVEEYADTSSAINMALRTQQRRLEQLSQQRDVLLTRVFDPNDARYFLAHLESLCAANACVLTSVVFPDHPGKHAATIVPTMTSVSVKGSYDGIVGFIEDLRTRPEMVVIESLRMTVGQAASEGIGCTIVFTIYVSNTEDVSP